MCDRVLLVLFGFWRIGDHILGFAGSNVSQSLPSLSRDVVLLIPLLQLTLQLFDSRLGGRHLIDGGMICLLLFHPLQTQGHECHNKDPNDRQYY